MKAAVVTQIGKLEVLEVPMPEIGPYDALCKMCYCATCAGTDIHLMDGKHPYPVSYPTVLGQEAVGRVVAIGSRVKHFKVGDLISRVGYPQNDRVGLYSNWGGFAQYGIAKDHWQMRADGRPFSEWNHSRVNQIIHPAIDEKTAPMIITWRETLSYLKRLGIGKATRLLLIGSGANALSFAAHACNCGADVTIVGSLSRKSSFEQLPISDYTDYKNNDLVESIGRVEKLYDVILDAVGSSETVNKMLPLLKRNGTIGVYGWNDRQRYGINPFTAQRSFNVYNDGYDEEETNEQVQAMVLSGVLKADLWYNMDHPVSLSDIADVYEHLRRHEAFKYLISLN